MPALIRRWLIFTSLAIGIVYALHFYTDVTRWGVLLREQTEEFSRPRHPGLTPHRDAFRKWHDVVKTFFPVPEDELRRLPTGPAADIPQLQYDFTKRKLNAQQQETRRYRLEAVKEAFTHSWEGYRKHAWLHDEVRPLTGKTNNPFGGWGATLVDSLDTLWLMGMEKEFAVAVRALQQIDFTTSTMHELNLFETTIRYLGGLLSANDLTRGKYPALLNKALELGEMLYHAFDTENRMPVNRWNWRKAEAGNAAQAASSVAVIAEIGSLSLEFTRLSQITSDPRYFDAVQRISEVLMKEQNETRIPGLWPVQVNPHKQNFHMDTTFSLGGMADSVFEYLPKQYLLLGGRMEMYQTLHLNVMQAVKKYLAFEPLIPHIGDEPEDNVSSDPAVIKPNPLILGTAHHAGASDKINHDAEGQHLTCFAAGMAALGAKAFAPVQSSSQTSEDLDVAERLAAGCYWSYRVTATGVGPEIFWAHPCRKGRAAVSSGLEADWTGEHGDCSWNRSRWLGAVRTAQSGDNKISASASDSSVESFVEKQNLPAGFTKVSDPRYMLRPEAIESLFVLYRTTGDVRYQEQAWNMFVSITALSRTDIAFAAVADVTMPLPVEQSGEQKPLGKRALFDSMESFWTAETLKYFYLIFAEESLCSLDEYVLNTEAHPFRWRDWFGIERKGRKAERHGWP